MATPAKLDFRIKANSYWERVWAITNSGVAMDISAYTFKLQIRNGKSNNAKIIMTLTMGDGIEFVDATLGTLRIEIPEQTQITTSTSYVYDFVMTTASKPVVLIEGTMTFDPGVTY